MGEQGKAWELPGSLDSFVGRHIGPDQDQIDSMLKTINYASMDALVGDTIPASILMEAGLDLPGERDEVSMVARAQELADKNVVMRSFIGMGYSPCITPAVIQRNILENPGWYTQYTPYQAEISQGRLEACLNFQTMVTDLTGMEIANASLLDEGTAAAEAMSLALNVARSKRHTFLVASDCHPQTVEVVKTRAEPLGIRVEMCDPESVGFHEDVFGLLLQYPGTEGVVRDYEALVSQAHDSKVMVVVAADLLSLALLRPPGDFGADIAIGTTQRFGVPLGFGGPHAAYFATKEEHKRRMAGRLVGVSKDTTGKPALRLALQTREQHIRRDRATSNICTSQVLLAVMASMYAVYHGPKGITRIAKRVKGLTELLASALRRVGHHVGEDPFFDTVRVEPRGVSMNSVLDALKANKLEVRQLSGEALTISLDEATTRDELQALIGAFGGKVSDLASALADATDTFDGVLARQGAILTHPIFSSCRSEHEMLRYMHRLQGKDLSLTTSMIPLGSCTMKLNATAEMLPVTMEGFAALHPFTDHANTLGYRELVEELEESLAEITGLPGVSLQPNAGSQGEYAGLLSIRHFHKSNGQDHRNICLIPGSAHGTNPASAVMAGMKVIGVGCDKHGNINLDELREKAVKHADNLAAIMITYPSTHGVFEHQIREICGMVHEHGGQVYMDGANMNAQVGLCRPGDFGVDVCHLNLHKTFCIPHGGGGPGVGPIAVAQHLIPFLPGHEHLPYETQCGPVAAAQWGSAGILSISWMYIKMMGGEGLRRASQVAILNANYLLKRLEGAYDILYTGKQGTVAHEFILDLRPLQKSAGITVADVAKRLMDYGFHAPTMSWPVAGTLMVEPTESESKAEMDRFVDALLTIREEIRAIEKGEQPQEGNLLKNAPHTAEVVSGDTWEYPYTRRQAAYPTAWVADNKFWPSVSRVDDAFGDRNLVCTCLPMEAYEDA
jgi:glycine dehydrogenase